MKKHTAFITGASSGIGLEFARNLAGRGYDLVLLARREDRLKEIKKELESGHSVKCDLIRADLSVEKDIKKAADYIKVHSEIDMLVNNAGFGIYSLFHNLESSDALRMLDVQLRSTIMLCSAALPAMVENGEGFIINVSSLAAFTNTPGSVMYNSCKSFLNSFSRTLAAEVRKKGIKVQALCPGFTHTGFHKDGKLKVFKDRQTPEWLWMNAEDVVRLSLKALGKKGKTIFVAGFRNRLFRFILRTNPFLRNYIDRQALLRTRE